MLQIVLKLKYFSMYTFAMHTKGLFEMKMLINLEIFYLSYHLISFSGKKFVIS